MDWVGLIMQIITLMMVDKIDVTRLSDLLGQPVHKGERRWRLEPAPVFRDAMTEAAISIETGLITTVTLRLDPHWSIQTSKLEQELNSSANELPPAPITIAPGSNPPPVPRTFAYNIQCDNKRGVVMITGRMTNPDISDEIDVTEILVRRYYRN